MKANISRRTFLQAAGIGALSVGLAACGGGSSGGVSPVNNSNSQSSNGSIIQTDKTSGSNSQKTTATYSASSLKNAQIRAINTARGANGNNTLTENSQLNQIAANIAAKQVSGGSILTNYLTYVFDTYNQKLEIDGKTVELNFSLEKYSLDLKNYTCSTSSQMATWDASYIGNAVVMTDDAFYCAAVFATPIVKVIWTGSTNDDGTITLTGYDKSGSAPTGDITLPSTLSGKQITVIGMDFLWKCETIIGVTIPGVIKKIYPNAFYGCKNLKKVIVQEGVNYIYSSAFSYCTSLQSVSLPSSLLSNSSNGIYSFSSQNIFEGCTSLKQINYPTNINTIYYKTFYGCTSLKKIYIPKSVTFIDNYAFYNCTSLTDIYYAGSQSEWNKVSIDSGNGYLLNATMHYYSTPL